VSREQALWQQPADGRLWTNAKQRTAARKINLVQKRRRKMDLATNYLGLHLRSPIVPSACPLTENLDNVKRLEDAGAGAIVFHSLFEEQLHHGRRDFFSEFHHRTESFAESIPNFPYPERFRC
jgi:hypothetical protein